MNMEDCGCASRHQLEEMPWRASQVRQQTTLQIPEIEDIPNSIQRPEIEGKCGHLKGGKTLEKNIMEEAN